MLRFVLEPSDLLAVRFDVRPGPLDDVRGASRALRRRSPVPLRGWRRAVLPRLTPDVALALMLQPPEGFGFDFTAPPGLALHEGLEAVVATPTRVLSSEVDEFALFHGPPPGPLRDLADGDLPTLHQIRDGLGKLHETLVAPYETRLNLIREADVIHRSALAARHGLTAVLDGLHPTVRLRGLVLEIDRTHEWTTRTSGAGIILIPSPWLHDDVRVQHCDDGPLRICYPAGRVTPDRPGADGPLSGLLGRTRARLLTALAHGDEPGTASLAADLGISAATASEHLGVLRRAGLVDTRRGRDGAAHTLTPVGAQLLSANL